MNETIILVPHLNGIDNECEQGLKQLESLGIRVHRAGGSSAIDVARNHMASEALQKGFKSIFFIDSDIGFNCNDALRLIARTEPVVSAVYAKKGNRQLTSVFATNVKEVVFGEQGQLYPLRYAATGFLRIKVDVLHQMIATLKLPLCNTNWGKGIWPFFQPMVVPYGDGKFHYLAEDWAFSYRLAQIGVTPYADTTIRLYHWGRYGYSWEDAGSTLPRYAAYNYKLGK